MVPTNNNSDKICVLAENIRYGKPDATQDEIEEATKIANCHEFIMELPNVSFFLLFCILDFII